MGDGLRQLEAPASNAICGNKGFEIGSGLWWNPDDGSRAHDFLFE